MSDKLRLTLHLHDPDSACQHCRRDAVFPKCTQELIVKKTDRIKKTIEILRRNKDLGWAGKKVLLHVYSLDTETKFDENKKWDDYVLRDDYEIWANTALKGYESSN